MVYCTTVKGLAVCYTFCYTKYVKETKELKAMIKKFILVLECKGVCNEKLTLVI